MEIIEHAIDAHCEGVMVEPVGGSTVGVLVLAGSSGRVETDRCRLLARTGMTTLSIRWFGGDGQPAGPARSRPKSWIRTGPSRPGAVDSWNAP